MSEPAPLFPSPPSKPRVSIAAILAILEPAIPYLSGVLAAWLLVHVHFLGIFHVTQSQTAKLIAELVVFSLTAGLTYASHHLHWLPIRLMRTLGSSNMTGLVGRRLNLVEILSFITPYVSVGAGALATWLLVHVHFLGLFHVGESQLAKVISSAIIMIVTSIVTWYAHTYNVIPLARRNVRLGRLDTPRNLR